MAKRKNNPSTEELRYGLENVYGEVGKLFSYYIWYSKVRPTLNENDPDVHILRTTIISGFFLTVRKLHEFLKGKRERDAKVGDVFASDFPDFTSKGGFLQDDDFKALHLHVGHITALKESSTGISGETYLATKWAYQSMSDFLSYLETTFLTDTVEIRKHKIWKSHIDSLMASYDQAVEQIQSR